jgi:hypothetical protein
MDIVRFSLWVVRFADRILAGGYDSTSAVAGPHPRRSFAREEAGNDSRQDAKLAKEEIPKFQNSGTWRSWRLGESFSGFLARDFFT